MFINLGIVESASFLEGLVPVSFSTTGLNAHDISVEDNTYKISVLFTLSCSKRIVYEYNKRSGKYFFCIQSGFKQKDNEENVNLGVYSVYLP